MSRPEPDELTAAMRKDLARAEARRFKRSRHSRRRQVWSCFWTWPLGHRYLDPQGRSPSQVFAEDRSSGGAHVELRCVGCGRPYGLFPSY